MNYQHVKVKRHELFEERLMIMIVKLEFMYESDSEYMSCPAKV